MNKSKTKGRVFTMAALGNLTACAVVSGIFLRYDLSLFPGMPTLRLAAAPFFIYISAFMFGPIAGGAVGLCSDLLTFIVKPSGAYMPTVTLCAALSGVLPGLFFRIVKKRILISAFVSVGVTLVISMLNSIFFWSLRHLIWADPPAEFFAALFFPRLFTATVLGIIYALLIPPLLTLLYKRAPFKGFFADKKIPEKTL